MKKLLLLLACCLALFASAQVNVSVDTNLLKQHVYTLASKDFEGRGTGESGEKKAAKYIVKELKKLKLTPKGDKGKYEQAFSFELKLPDPANPHGALVSKGIIKGKNIIGLLDNAAENTIIIGAHYDHLGLGELGGSREANPKGIIHYGADDNASGVAALLELARVLQNNNKIEEHNYLFIFFSGEEQGLYGSKHFAANPTIPLEQVNFMVNLDMVGRLDATTKKLIVHGVGSSNEFGQHLFAANQTALQLAFDSSGVGPSDFTSFYRKDLPVLGLFTGQHADYHKESDTPEKLNYQGEKEVLDFLSRFLSRMDTMPKQSFTKTKEMQMGRTKFKVTMGIMPDYAFSGPGVKVDGVTDDKPAAIAGVKPGDVILAIGDTDLSDMGVYMGVLGKLNPGDQQTIKLKRGEELLELKVKF